MKVLTAGEIIISPVIRQPTSHPGGRNRVSRRFCSLSHGSLHSFSQFPPPFSCLLYPFQQHRSPKRNLQPTQSRPRGKMAYFAHLVGKVAKLSQKINSECKSSLKAQMTMMTSPQVRLEIRDWRSTVMKLMGTTSLSNITLLEIPLDPVMAERTAHLSNQLSSEDKQLSMLF